MTMEVNQQNRNALMDSEHNYKQILMNAKTKQETDKTNANQKRIDLWINR